MRAGGSALVLVLSLWASWGCAAPTPAPAAAALPVGGDGALAAVFRAVGEESGVPAELLAAVSYVETRFAFARGYQAEAGAHPGHTLGGALGPLALREGGPRDVVRAAALAGLPEAAVHTDPHAAVLAAAAVLRAGAPGARTLAEFAPALIAYGDRDGASFAAEVYHQLAVGIRGRDEDGGLIVVPAQPGLAALASSTASSTASPRVVAAAAVDGYPGARWVAANATNFQVASRGVADVDHIVIHDTEGSYNSAISWFQDPTAKVSAHYVIRSSDGEVTQMVSDKDIAWHDACFNTHSVGIEHEGYEAAPTKWFTETMYVQSAKVTAWLADHYGIAKMHGPILGHGEAPDCSTHTDPGPGWDWAHYIDLVQTGGAPQLGAGDAVIDAPLAMTSGELIEVDIALTNRGGTAWDPAMTRLGTQAPQDRASAFFVVDGKPGDWISPSRAAAADAMIAPSAVGHFRFTLRAPDVGQLTTFDEGFQLVQENVGWFGPVLHLPISVSPAATAAHDGCAVGGGAAPAGAIALIVLGLVGRRRRPAGARSGAR